MNDFWEPRHRSEPSVFWDTGYKPTKYDPKKDQRKIDMLYISRMFWVLIFLSTVPFFLIY